MLGVGGDVGHGGVNQEWKVLYNVQKRNRTIVRKF